LHVIARQTFHSRSASIQQADDIQMRVGVRHIGVMEATVTNTNRRGHLKMKL
jgi:hypothetical protein